MSKTVHYLGLDVHKETIAVSIAPAHSTEVRRYGIINGSLDAVDKLLKKLAQPGIELRVVYEAGPCGFVICRHLRSKAALRSSPRRNAVSNAGSARSRSSTRSQSRILASGTAARSAAARMRVTSRRPGLLLRKDFLRAGSNAAAALRRCEGSSKGAGLRRKPRR